MPQRKKKPSVKPVKNKRPGRSAPRAKKPATHSPSAATRSAPSAANPRPGPATSRRYTRLERFLKVLGPGLVTGASDDDPSGIGTYAMAGAAYGYATLWTALFTFPMMAAVQYICARIGLVSGKGIASVIRQHYSRWLLYPVVVALLLANTLNAAADLAAIAAGVNLLLPDIPVWLLVVPAGLGLLAMQVWGSYRTISSIFKWLTLSLLAYIASALLSRPHWPEVLRATIIPTIQFDGQYLAILVALLGTTISPYLFFWQASQEVEEREKTACGRKRLWRRRGPSDSDLEYAFWDVNVGMLLSNVVMFFIILATATTLHRAGKTDVETATDAAEALRPIAGDAAYLLMALGLIGAGVLAVPVLTCSGAYAAAEAFGWRFGLDKKPRQATEFYLVMAVSTVVAVLIVLLGMNPVKALLWSSVANGFLAPPLLVVIMLIANNRRIMGERVNNRWLNVLGWVTTIAMFAAAVALVATSI